MNKLTFQYSVAVVPLLQPSEVIPIYTLGFCFCKEPLPDTKKSRSLSPATKEPVQTERRSPCAATADDVRRNSDQLKYLVAETCEQEPPVDILPADRDTGNGRKPVLVIPETVPMDYSQDYSSDDNDGDEDDNVPDAMIRREHPPLHTSTPVCQQQRLNRGDRKSDKSEVAVRLDSLECSSDKDMSENILSGRYLPTGKEPKAGTAGEPTVIEMLPEPGSPTLGVPLEVIRQQKAGAQTRSPSLFDEEEDGGDERTHRGRNSKRAGSSNRADSRKHDVICVDDDDHDDVRKTAKGRKLTLSDQKMKSLLWGLSRDSEKVSPSVLTGRMKSLMFVGDDRGEVEEQAQGRPSSDNNSSPSYRTRSKLKGGIATRQMVTSEHDRESRQRGRPGKALVQTTLSQFDAERTQSSIRPSRTTVVANTKESETDVPDTVQTHREQSMFPGDIHFTEPPFTSTPREGKAKNKKKEVMPEFKKPEAPPQSRQGRPQGAVTVQSDTVRQFRPAIIDIPPDSVPATSKPYTETVPESASQIAWNGTLAPNLHLSQYEDTPTDTAHTVTQSPGRDRHDRTAGDSSPGGHGDARLQGDIHGEEGQWS